MFADLSENQGVEIRWLKVDGKAMNIDHLPCNEFEKQAARALSSGQPSYESVEDGLFRFAGPVRMHNVCLKCHVPNRTSLEDRTAGLVISMHVQTTPDGNKQATDDDQNP